MIFDNEGGFMEVSKEWTAEERLQVVGKISNDLYNYIKVQHDEKLYDATERLGFLSRASTSFLEANKASIIDGQKLNRNIQ